MNTSQILAMLNSKVSRAEQKKYRLEILLANTIAILEEEQIFDTHKRMLDNLGMTEKEYIEIMGE